MRVLRAASLMVALVWFAACTPLARPAPSTPLATPSAACVEAWQAVLANPSDQTASDATMHACRSLEEFAAGDEAARAGGTPDVEPKVIAQSACETGRFSDTPICQQLGITPTPGVSFPPASAAAT
jgi:hypothetical protein